MIEVIEIEPWKFKVRSLTNRRKWYEVIHRRDNSFWCNCANFKYNGQIDNHILAVEAMINESNYPCVIAVELREEQDEES